MRRVALLAAAVALLGGASSAHAAPPTTLDAGTGRTVAAAFAGDCGACEDQVSECERLSPRRIDCVVADASACSFVIATRVGRSGHLFYDRYACASETPPTAAAQVRTHPPGGQDFQPLTPAAFAFAADVFPRNLRYPAYPVRHYRGRTSQGEPVDLWTTRKHVLLDGSGVGFDAACWRGPAVLRLGRVAVRGGTTIVSRRARPDDASTPAHRLRAELIAHRRRAAGTLRLLRLSCARSPITFTARIVGRPGF